MIVLVGFMGAGKTTVGRLLADRLGLPFVDTDLVVEDRERRTIPQIFEADGESAFRDVEQVVVADVLSGPEAVVSLGGGACGREGTREVLRTHTVVHLDVSFEQAKRRTAGDTYRPMLRRPDLADLHATRREVFRSLADVDVATDGRRAEVIALEVLDGVTGQEGVLVAPPGGTYRVQVRRGLLAEAGPTCLRPARRSSSPERTTPALTSLRRSLSGPSTSWNCPPGPSRRSPPTSSWRCRPPTPPCTPTTSCWRWETRASSTSRGSWPPPTTGGPAGPSSRVRWRPWSTPPSVGRSPSTCRRPATSWGGAPAGGCAQRPRRRHPATDPRFGAGVAEAVKTALVADPSDLDLLLEQAPAVLAGDVEAVAALVRRAVATKARIVTADEREAAGRLHLNYGHTFSHAFEQLGVDRDALPAGAHGRGAPGPAPRVPRRRRRRAAPHRPPRVRPADSAPVRPGRPEAVVVAGQEVQGRCPVRAAARPGPPEAGVPATDDALTGALDDLAEDR